MFAIYQKVLGKRLVIPIQVLVLHKHLCFIRLYVLKMYISLWITYKLYFPSIHNVLLTAALKMYIEIHLKYTNFIFHSQVYQEKSQMDWLYNIYFYLL